MNNLNFLMILRNILIISPLFVIPLLQGCAVALVPAAATSVAVAHDRRTTGTIVDDHSIEIKATHALSEDKPVWRLSRVIPVSYNNVLVLVGQAPTQELKQKAEQLVSDLPRVRRIHNELTIQEPISLAQRSQDTWITTQIKAKMLRSKEVKPTHVKVVTENGVVYLMGLATPEEAAATTDIAKQIEGVDKIVQIFEPH